MCPLVYTHMIYLYLYSMYIYIHVWNTFKERICIYFNYIHFEIAETWCKNPSPPLEVWKCPENCEKSSPLAIHRQAPKAC